MSYQTLMEKEFTLEKDIIYLNHAAVSPWPKRTAAAVIEFAEENQQSGATYYKKWLGKELQLRQQLQSLINAPSIDDIGLLKNTSEALSVVSSGIRWQQGDNIVTTNEEFPSNRIPWEAQANKGVSIREIDISNSETAEQAIIAATDEQTRLIAISSVQYGSGRRLNLEIIGQHCRENGILFCVDAIQSLGILDIDVQATGADFIMADAHKWMLGPEGIALFYCAEHVRNQLKLHQFGWHMIEEVEDYTHHDWRPADSAKRFECGSPNMLGIFALSASLSLIDEIGIEPITRMIMKNTGYIIDYIVNKKNMRLLTPATEKARGGIVTFIINDCDNAEIYHKLMKNKVICANRKGGIRLSPHFYTSLEKIQKGLDIIDSVI